LERVRTLGVLPETNGVTDLRRRSRQERDVEKSTTNLKEKAFEELKEYGVIAFYLWLIFGLLALYKSVILREEHIDFVARGFALINALALGKVLLLIRALHLGDRFNDRPLIYTALMKSALFAVVLAVFKIVEEFAIGLYHHKSFQQSIAEIGGGTVQGIFVLTLILFVVLIPFVGVMELQTSLGEDKFKQMFLEPRPSAGLPKRAA
jgi:hypothetical protein